MLSIVNLSLKILLKPQKHAVDRKFEEKEGYGVEENTWYKPRSEKIDSLESVLSSLLDIES